MIKNNINNFYVSESISWFIKSCDYKPSKGYNCKVIFSKALVKLEFVADIDSINDYFIINKTASETSSYEEGLYNVYVNFYKSSEGFSKIEKISITEIKADITDISELEVETQNEKILKAINDTIEGRVVDGIDNYEININGNNRKLQYVSLQDLLKARDKYKNIVDSEKGLEELEKYGRTNRNKIKTIFVPPYRY